MDTRADAWRHFHGPHLATTVRRKLTDTLIEVESAIAEFLRGADELIQDFSRVSAERVWVSNRIAWSLMFPYRRLVLRTNRAIVEEFRDRATLMISTEAGAEGINLQFASLVVNYDLPWNPQRIEQRIGRCHRYGQQHDVVVVNFINRRNEADLRVFQLLSEKFQLFDGVFGASDEVLGALESGVDIERRIAQVYQECRSTDEIQPRDATLSNRAPSRAVAASLRSGVTAVARDS